MVTPPSSPKPDSAERGYALLLALVVISLVSLALTLVFASLALRLRQAQIETQTIHLVALSDAGMAEALAALANDAAFVGMSRHKLGHGIIWSKVEVDFSHQIEPGVPEMLRVTSQATYAGRGRGAEALVQLDGRGGLLVKSWRRIAAEPPAPATAFKPRE